MDCNKRRKRSSVDKSLNQTSEFDTRGAGREARGVPLLAPTAAVGSTRVRMLARQHRPRTPVRTYSSPNSVALRSSSIVALFEKQLYQNIFASGQGMIFRWFLSRLVSFWSPAIKSVDPANSPCSYPESCPDARQKKIGFPGPATAQPRKDSRGMGRFITVPLFWHVGHLLHDTTKRCASHCALQITANHEPFDVPVTLSLRTMSSEIPEPNLGNAFVLWNVFNSVGFKSLAACLRVFLRPLQSIKYELSKYTFRCVIDTE